MSKEEAVTLTVNIPVKLKARVQKRAEEEGRTMTDIVMEAFAHYVIVGDLARRIEILENRLDALEKNVNKK